MKLYGICRNLDTHFVVYIRFSVEEWSFVIQKAVKKSYYTVE